MKRRATTGQMSPGDVLVRAYRAASRGRYAEAGRLAVPSLRESFIDNARLMRNARKELAAQIANGVSPAIRGRLVDTLAMLRQFEDPNYCWKQTARCGSLKSVAIARQTIRGKESRVTLRLTLEDGSVVTETESLVLTPAGWRIGEITALQNNGLQPTKAARCAPSPSAHGGSR